MPQHSHQNAHLPFLREMPRREIIEFLIAITIQAFGTSIIVLFEPIYLHTLGYSIPQIMLFYIAAYGIYFFLIPFGGKIAKHRGYEHTLLYSLFPLVAYYILLYGIGDFPFLIFIAPIALAVAKTLYWPAFHADMARFGKDKQIAREVGLLNALIMIGSIVGPIVGGVLLAIFGFKVLFLVAAVIIFSSTIPLFTTHEHKRKHPFEWKWMMRFLFKKENRRRFWNYFAFGEELITMTVWPIFIYIAVTDFFSLGGIVSISMALAVVAALVVGRYAHRKGYKLSFSRGGVLAYLFSWPLRILALTPVGVLLFETYWRVTRTFFWIPLQTTMYRTAKEEGIMSHSVLFEMALVLGKVFVALIVLIIFSTVDHNPYLWTFILAGVFSLLYFAYKPIKK